MTIRRARQSDVAGIMACLAAAFEPYRARYTAGAFEDTIMTVPAAEHRLREMTVLVAEDESAQIVGTIAHRVVSRGEGHLRGMAVIPEYQKRGVAERLLLIAESELRGAGCARVTLDTTTHLQTAIRFYVRHGYAATGTVTDFFGMPLFEYGKTWDRETR